MLALAHEMAQTCSALPSLYLGMGFLSSMLKVPWRSCLFCWTEEAVEAEENEGFGVQ
jgi:hypothetical protein